MTSDLDNFQRIELEPNLPQREYKLQPPGGRRIPTGCLMAGLVICIVPCLLFLLLGLIPGRTNVLLLGVDARPGEGDLGRTDTMILTTFQPLRPYAGMLTIPRDLWVNVPNVGEQRINTAHFFAEAEKTGSGPAAAMETVRQNFGVDVHFYIRIRFDGLKGLVDALGGLDITLPVAMSGYEEGTHHLDGTQALAFVRDRAGSNDLFRNERAIIFLKAFMSRILNPTAWPHLPAFLAALGQAVDSDIPWWAWPRLGMALLRVGPDGIDGRSITHEMITPFTTSGGASVLLPNWEQINPVLLEVFGQ